MQFKRKGRHWLACGAAVLAAFLAPVAQAVVIDFEDPDLVGLYFDGDSFSQSGFVFTQFFDAGTVDFGSLALGAAAPTNNATQFYTNTNDGYLQMTSVGGVPFSLDGFSAAFVPLLGSTAPAQTLGIVAVATPLVGESFGLIFGLGDTSSTSSGSPFFTYSSQLDFGDFTNLLSVDFYTCTIANGQFCSLATRNNGQFALDNIVATSVAAPIPEPETVALMGLGLLALTAAARRRRVR